MKDIHMYQEKAQVDGEVLKVIYDQAFPEELSCQAWMEVREMDDPKYDVLKARLIKITTVIEEPKIMHHKPLLQIYQSSRHSK
jgi:hypothetical protein